METRPNNSNRSTGLPEMLTVEEAARFMRIGRTKAYAMAREWRDSGGSSGLPTVDLGHVLRVPRWRLELMLSGALGEPDVAAEVRVRPADEPTASTAGTGADGVGRDPETTRQERPTGRKQDRIDDCVFQASGGPACDGRRFEGSVVAVEGFSKPDFWIWMGVIFAVNAIAAAVLGVAVLAVGDAVTAFFALLTAALLGRDAVRK